MSFCIYWKIAVQAYFVLKFSGTFLHLVVFMWATFDFSGSEILSNSDSWEYTVKTRFGGESGYPDVNMHKAYFQLVFNKYSTSNYLLLDADECKAS